MSKYTSFGALGLAIIAIIIAVVGGNNQPQTVYVPSNNNEEFSGFTRYPNSEVHSQGFIATASSSRFRNTAVNQLTYGRTRTSTTTNGATDTLTGTIMEANNLVDYTVGRTAGLTLTLQATSSWPSTFLPNVGDEKMLTIVNSTTTNAGVPLTLAAGAGVIFQNSTTSLVLGENDNVLIHLVRENDTDVTARLIFFK